MTRNAHVTTVEEAVESVMSRATRVVNEWRDLRSRRIYNPVPADMSRALDDLTDAMSHFYNDFESVRELYRRLVDQRNHRAGAHT